MFTVQTRILGKYVTTGYADSYKEAFQLEEEEREKGWLFTRILDSEGEELLDIRVFQAEAVEEF